MRTTLNIPDDLLDEARALLQFQSKTDTVVVALQELIRRRKVEKLKQLAGRVPLRIDVAEARRRPGGRRKHGGHG